MSVAVDDKAAVRFMSFVFRFLRDPNSLNRHFVGMKWKHNLCTLICSRLHVPAVSEVVSLEALR